MQIGNLENYEVRQAIVQHDHILSFLALANMTASKETLIFLLERMLKDPLTPTGRALVEAAIAHAKSED